MILRIAILFCGFLLTGSPVTALTDEECFQCHSDSTLRGTSAQGKDVSAFVDRALFGQSVHADVGCVSCHKDVTEVPHSDALAVVDCGECHSDVAEEYKGSLHGRAATGGNGNVPSCSSCHGKHQIRASADSTSSVFPARLLETCGKCHSDSSTIPGETALLKSPYGLYKGGVHSQALARGVTAAASCNDCHDSHRLKSANDPASPIFRQNIPATCSKCHKDAYQQYETGIHGKAVAAGSRDAPVCTGCHGEHGILGPSDPSSPVAARNIPGTCSACHENVRFAGRYGFPRSRLTTYMDTYHGLANKAGVTLVANCASCHGAHGILPSSDPTSSVNKQNLPTTCGKCHPNAGVNFAKGQVHLTSAAEEGRLVALVRRFYLLMILVTIGGMSLHNGLDFVRQARAAYGRRLARSADARREKRDGTNVYLRWTAQERCQHWIMAASFITLAVTGFALKYPEEWWVSPFVGNGHSIDWRGIVHRAAAVVFMGLSLYHVAYLALSRRGREQARAMMWRLSDLREIRQMLMLNTGLSSERPSFDRFNYIEKSEYWALIWGGVVMAVTGLLLWFENTAMTYVPKWLLDVATTVHLYEGWLATLAIVVWHFYAVILNPQVYPLNWSMVTGWITEEEMHEEHTAEYERIRSASGKR